MPNGYKVRLESAVSDGTNIFTVMKIDSPTQTLPNISPVFKVGTTAATIRAYMQVIATTGPTLATEVSDLVGLVVAGA